jgi:hypothetical protein
MARPLVKTNKNGVLIRPPTVEAKIDAALAQDWFTLSAQARVTDPRSPDFLSSECLVHLIRDAIRRDDERVSRVLMPHLLSRAEANLLRTVPDSRMRNAESVRQNILSSLAMMFIEERSEEQQKELDFYECKFLSALRFLRIDHVRAEISSRKEVTDLPQAGSDQDGAPLDDEMLARLSGAASIGPSQEDAVYLRQVLAALNRLPADQKRAVILRRVIGHEEDKAASIIGVEGRTVRYRLARADKQLKTWKEDL